MKTRNTVIAVLLLAIFVLMMELRTSLKETNRYREIYYTAQKQYLDAQGVENHTMANWSECLADKAAETLILTKCERDLYDLREWLRDKYNKGEI